MTATNEIPDDPALPALAAIRTRGLARTNPWLGLGDRPLQLALCGYSPGPRATLEARAFRRRLAVKAHAEDPGEEARAPRENEPWMLARVVGDAGT